MKKPVLFILFLLAMLLSSCGKTTEIDLTKYVHYEISGVNGKGKMFLSLDEQLYADATEKNEKISADALRKIIERDVVLSSGSDRLLSNGDEALIEVSCLSEDEALTKAGIRLMTGTKTVKVAGLPEAREIDLTKELLIDVQGFDGSGTLSVAFAEKLYNSIADLSKDITTEKARELLQASVPVKADKSSELSDGDTVKITVDASNANAVFLEQGLVLTGGEVSYAVSGLTPLTHFKASDYVSYNMTGTVPYLVVYFNFSANAPQELTRYITLPVIREITLRKGETEAFEIKYSEAELRSRGYVCDEAVLSVSPDGFELEQYLEKLAQISEEEMQKLQDDTKDSAYATALYETKHLTLNEGEVFGDTLDKVTLESAMLFVRKHMSESEPLNRLMMVYRADYSPTSGYGSHDAKLYVTLTYDTVKLEPSGTIIYSEPTVEIKRQDTLETDIALLKADYEQEEIKGE